MWRIAAIVATSVAIALSSACTGTPATPATGPTAAASVIPLAIGAATRIGPDYVVAVASANLHAKNVITTASPSQAPPKGQYVVARLRTTYTGHTKADPQRDLLVTFKGSDSHTYRSNCTADAAGSASTYFVCFDLPEKAISGGHFSVAERVRPDDRTLWEINP